MNRTRKGWWWIWPRQILYIIRVLETWSLVVSGSLFSTYTGWWYTYPSEKYKSQLGWLFPIYGKSWKFIFQTTNQYTSNIYIKKKTKYLRQFRPPKCRGELFRSPLNQHQVADIAGESNKMSVSVWRLDDLNQHKQGPGGLLGDASHFTVPTCANNSYVR